MALYLDRPSASSQPISQNISALKQVFESIEADSCPYSYNFHMHTVCSDGRLQAEALIEQALTIGLKGFAITDHHTVRGYQLAQHHLEDYASVASSKSRSELPHLWTGVEITANLLGTEVHILGYGFDPQHPGLQLYLQGKAPQDGDAQAANVIVALHQAGGLAVLAHPSRYRRPAEDLIPIAAHLGIDAVETYYAYNNPNPWRPSPTETEKVKNLSAAYNLLNTCGTDTHGLSLLQRL